MSKIAMPTPPKGYSIPDLPPTPTEYTDRFHPFIARQLWHLHWCQKIQKQEWRRHIPRHLDDYWELRINYCRRVLNESSDTWKESVCP